MYLVEQKNEINASSFCKFFNQTKKAKVFAHLAKRTLAAHDSKERCMGRVACGRQDRYVEM